MLCFFVLGSGNSLNLRGYRQQTENERAGTPAKLIVGLVTSKVGSQKTMGFWVAQNG